MLSIITSLYKTEKYLPSFLKKIDIMSKKLEAKNIDHEFLLISNVPSETELKLIEQYVKINTHIKKNVRPLETIYASWNEGVSSSKYENITFWNVDDTRFLGGFVKGIEEIRNGAEIVYFPFWYIRYIRILKKILIPVKLKKFIPIEYDKERLKKEMHCGPFFMVKKEAFNKIGLFDDTFKISGDFEWLSRAAQNDIIFCRSLETGGIFTNDGYTLSGSKDKKHKEENDRIFRSVKS